MLQERIGLESRARKNFHVGLARHQDEVREAQRLRWKIFAVVNFLRMKEIRFLIERNTQRLLRVA